MEHVGSAIAEVESEIRNAESKAEAADSTGNPETASYWRTKEQQLREKERQLREKELLTLRRSGADSPSLKDYSKVPGYSTFLGKYGLNTPIDQFHFWIAAGGLMGGATYAVTRFQNARLLHHAVALEKAGKTEEADWCRVRTGAPPAAIKDAEVFIRQFRQRGFRGIAALSAPVLWIVYILQRKKS